MTNYDQTAKKIYDAYHKELEPYLAVMGLPRYKLWEELSNTRKAPWMAAAKVVYNEDMDTSIDLNSRAKVSAVGFYLTDWPEGVDECQVYDKIVEDSNYLDDCTVWLPMEGHSNETLAYWLVSSYQSNLQEYTMIYEYGRSTVRPLVNSLINSIEQELVYLLMKTNYNGKIPLTSETLEQAKVFLKLTTP